MLDYTFNGLPVAQMATADIEDCLRDGLVFNDLSGHTIEYAETCVRQRLELELFIRANAMRRA